MQQAGIATKAQVVKNERQEGGARLIDHAVVTHLFHHGQAVLKIIGVIVEGRDKFRNCKPVLFFFFNHLGRSLSRDGR